MLPIFGGGEIGAKGDVKKGTDQAQEYEEVPVNLELPQHVADLLRKVHSNKWIILENFHYLNDETQKQFAFDLRAYQELGVRFVILGVWREKNRMALFNGDLLDRVVEVPVEPWEDRDFRRVAIKGADKLNISFSSTLVDGAIDASFASIGVFQEILKGICVEAGITETKPQSLAGIALVAPELLN